MYSKLTEPFKLSHSKLFWLVTAIAVVGLIASAVAFNSVQNLYDETDDAAITLYIQNNPEWIMEQLQKTENWDLNLVQVITRLDVDHHETLDEVSKNFTSVAKAHKNLMAMVVTEETTGITEPVATAGFNLVTDQEWKRGELITITGSLPQKATLDAVITHITDEEFERTFNVAVFDDKSFTMPFSLSSDSPLGQYTVTFKSLGKFDSISFKAIE